MMGGPLFSPAWPEIINPAEERIEARALTPRIRYRSSPA